MGQKLGDYLNLPRALSEETWRAEGNCTAPNRGQAQQHYWCGVKANNAQKGGVTKAQYAMALALCEICPVQWECVRYAILMNDPFCAWAVDLEDRVLLSQLDDWQERIAMAKAAGRSVASVVLEIRTAHAA